MKIYPLLLTNLNIYKHIPPVIYIIMYLIDTQVFFGKIHYNYNKFFTCKCLMALFELHIHLFLNLGILEQKYHFSLNTLKED